ncbi:MAG: aspartate--tRNA ligase, partial [Hyphomicrobiales bacterium]|nr:aspartate--tRNA ligase [Hyphomicrobiales bacterium]
QLDFEMSFVTQEDVFAAVEPVLKGVFEEFADGRPVTPVFPRIPYDRAVLEYGVDKPDLRNPIKVVDVTDVFSRDDVTFNAFKQVIRAGGVVRAIPAPGAAAQPRSFFDKLDGWAKDEGALGLGYIIFEAETGVAPGSVREALVEAFIEDGSDHKLREGASGASLVGKGPIAKFLSRDAQQALAAKARLAAGDAVFFACDKPQKAAKLAGAARLRIGHDLGVSRTDAFEFCWIVDFPMYEWNEEEKKIDFSHNPFSMPQGGLEALEREDPLAIKAFQYDIICNGVELSSGAIRNHRPDIMKKAFEIAGYGEDALMAKFGGMYRAFQCGAPPHGGIAPGVDRIVMLLAGEENLREVVLFPMNQRAEDLMMGAPAAVTAKQLRELNIRLAQPEK